MLDYVRRSDLVRRIFCQHRQYHIHDTHLHRDAQRALRSYQDQAAHGPLNYLDFARLHWQHGPLPHILLGELRRWTLLAEGDDHNADHMVPTASL